MEEEYHDNVKYVITPKGFVFATMLKLGLSENEAEDFWYKLEAFCLKTIKCEFPDAEYPAIVFDGNGGVVIGLNDEL